MPSPRDVANDLGRLIRGEIEVRDFPWLTDEERRSLGSLGMSMLKAGNAAMARAAFGVLVDLEPDAALHRLMVGHAYALEDRVHDAFTSFGRAIQLVSEDAAQQEVASEAFLARGDLLLRLGRVVEARADLAEAASRMGDPGRKQSIEAFLAQ